MAWDRQITCDLWKLKGKIYLFNLSEICYQLHMCSKSENETPNTLRDVTPVGHLYIIVTSHNSIILSSMCLKLAEPHSLMQLHMCIKFGFQSLNSSGDLAPGGHFSHSSINVWNCQPHSHIWPCTRVKFDLETNSLRDMAPDG